MLARMGEPQVAKKPSSRLSGIELFACAGPRRKYASFVKELGYLRWIRHNVEIIRSEVMHDLLRPLPNRRVVRTKRSDVDLIAELGHILNSHRGADITARQVQTGEPPAFVK
jgi:hypothetical protein